MTVHYVSDYEELTGLKPDGAPLVETKVVGAPAKPEVAPVAEAKVKVKAK